MRYIALSLFASVSTMLSTVAYSQKDNSISKFVVQNEWITYDILNDTIELTRVRPLKKYGLIKTITFDKQHFNVIYGYTSKPKRPYLTCGTGELDVDGHKSNFQVLENGELLIEIYASMLSDKSYSYHFIKEFKCVRLTKDKWRLITTNAKVNEIKSTGPN